MKQIYIYVYNIQDDANIQNHRMSCDTVHLIGSLIMNKSDKNTTEMMIFNI